MASLVNVILFPILACLKFHSVNPGLLQNSLLVHLIHRQNSSIVSTPFHFSKHISALFSLMIYIGGEVGRDLGWMLIQGFPKI